MQNPVSFHKGGKHECYKGWSIVTGPLLPSHCPVFLSSTFFFSAVSISWGYHDEFKTWRLKIVEMDSLLVLEAKTPKVISLGWNYGVGQVTRLVETRGTVGGSCSWPLPGFGGSAFLGLWSHLSSLQGWRRQISLLCLHMVFSSVCVLNLLLALSCKDAYVSI